MTAMGHSETERSRTGTTDEESAEAVASSDLVGVEHLRDSEMTNLSGGQKQIARITMVLAQETDVLLLDEPTTFLDLHHRGALGRPDAEPGGRRDRRPRALRHRPDGSFRRQSRCDVGGLAVRLGAAHRSRDRTAPRRRVQRRRHRRQDSPTARSRCESWDTGWVNAPSPRRGTDRHRNSDRPDSRSVRTAPKVPPLRSPAIAAANGFTIAICGLRARSKSRLGANS